MLASQEPELLGFLEFRIRRKKDGMLSPIWLSHVLSYCLNGRLCSCGMCPFIFEITELLTYYQAEHVMVVHTFDPSMGKAVAGKSVRSRPAWSI